MPLRGCSSGLLATALVVFLVVPVQYYVPDLYLEPKDVLIAEPQLNRETPASTDYYHWISLEHLPPFDLFLTISLLTLAIITHLCDWIQRKLMERRIVKLNYYLTESVGRLRAWDARQEQLEATLRMVQNATSEYNLLLYLLLRQHRKLGGHKAPPSHCFFDKEFDDLNFIRNPTIDS
ncbi:uncharacterized protein [Epargyreus clarus]|uniref:uncharacterized protein n=1 Tax=Epargyreus clarus TaxID=520877 RepID=UPI003C2B83DE